MVDRSVPKRGKKEAGGAVRKSKLTPEQKEERRRVRAAKRKAMAEAGAKISSEEITGMLAQAREMSKEIAKVTDAMYSKLEEKTGKNPAEFAALGLGLG